MMMGDDGPSILPMFFLVLVVAGLILAIVSAAKGPAAVPLPVIVIVIFGVGFTAWAIFHQEVQ